MLKKYIKLKIRKQYTDIFVQIIIYSNFERKLCEFITIEIVTLI